MKQLIRPVPIGQVHNPNAAPGTPYGPALEAILNAEGFESARREISGWPGSTRRPRCTVSPAWREPPGWPRFGTRTRAAASVWAVSRRSAAPYAVSRVLTREVAAQRGQGPVSAADLRAGRHRGLVAGLTVCAATDGNHGRSVSWGARLFGSRCVIYIPDAVSPGRQRAMERYGAEVRRIDGTFDDAVRKADEDAAARGWIVVADTTYPGYTEIPRDVMHGYGVMAAEVIAQLPEAAAPSHVFVQGGVGGLAAAVCARLWQHYGAARPRYAVVEPEAAALLLRQRPGRAAGGGPG